MRPQAERQPSEQAAAERFLTRLADPSRPPLEATAVVVAHPDDETIGCGVQLSRLAGGPIVLITDGAPRDLRDARAHGFEDAPSYAAARQLEARAALAAAGVPETSLAPFGIPDQQAAVHLPELARRLMELFASSGIRHVLTHCYEGGHPDHDATAFAVHAAAALDRSIEWPVLVVEMPYYRLGPAGVLFRSFANDPELSDVTITLNEDDLALKQRMVAAHITQKDTLQPFPLEQERFRAAPCYDFTGLPNGGLLYYARFEWGMTGARWCELARAAQRALGLEGVM